MGRPRQSQSAAIFCKRDFPLQEPSGHGSYFCLLEVAALIGLVERTKANLKPWMAPVEVPVPRFLRETGHKAMVYREPYGVSLIMGPFNGPLPLLMRPAITALAAGNTCIRAIAPVGPHRQRSAVCKLPSASWEAWARTAHRTRHRSRRVDAEC